MVYRENKDTEPYPMSDLKSVFTSFDSRVNKNISIEEKIALDEKYKNNTNSEGE